MRAKRLKTHVDWPVERLIDRSNSFAAPNMINRLNIDAARCKDWPVNKHPEDDEELTEDDRAAIQTGLDSLAKHGPIPMEDILADFGLTTADFEKLTATVTRRNG